MQFIGFQVFNFRNIRDSGYISVNNVTAFVGQNEAGKSNLFEALNGINSFDSTFAYKLDEDWPVDNWAEKENGKVVCVAEFQLTPEEIEEVAYNCSAAVDADADEEEVALPDSLMLRAASYYGKPTEYRLVPDTAVSVDNAKLQAWAKSNVPKFVYIHDYELSGHQVELDQLQQRLTTKKFHELSNEDQTIAIVLQLAKIELNDFVSKGTTSEGRTVRAFDRRQASAYLTSQFAKLWQQKAVRFDLDVDATTLNIFVEDDAVGMPVRLSRRSTGFRWYVSFAWKFTHASKGQYKNCILLLEEPGIHLHYAGQRDLIEVFERLAEQNSILYTTHLASMIDLKNPERVRIVENRKGHTTVKQGVVSSQRAPMAVIEASLGIVGDLSGLLGNRQVLIVEGGDDALILQKLSGLFASSGKKGIPDRVYLWPANGAPHTPMYASFAVGQKWDAGVLLDSDGEGEKAKEKISAMQQKAIAEGNGTSFRVLMLGKVIGSAANEVAIEGLFPEDLYLSWVNQTYRTAIAAAHLPVDGSQLITHRVESVLKLQHQLSGLDKSRVMGEMLKSFDQWKSVTDLPQHTQSAAEKLFEKLHEAFGGISPDHGSVTKKPK